MSSEQDAFLKDLQSQCLGDSKEYLDGIVEALSRLQTDVSEALKIVGKNIHSLKGNVQAAGFVHFGKYLHDFESILGMVEKALQEGKTIPEDEKSVLEFLVSDVHHYLGDYVLALNGDFNDSEEKYNARKQCLTNLETWWKIAQGEKISEEVLKKGEVSPEETESLQAQASVGETSADESVHAMPATPKEIEDSEPVNLLHYYLLCRVGSRHYGIDVDHITEVINNLPIIKLPMSRDDIRGLINLRGETVSILSMSKILGATKEGAFLVVCTHGGRAFGFEVDEAEQIIGIKDDELKELSISGGVKSSNEPITSVAYINQPSGDREVLILNLHQVIAA